MGVVVVVDVAVIVDVAAVVAIVIAGGFLAAVALDVVVVGCVYVPTE